MSKRSRAILIGVSAGGFKALHTILPLFPENFSIPILIVQHRIAAQDNYLVESLNIESKLHVKEAEDKEESKGGCAYIAPGGYHLLVEKDFSHSLSADDPVMFARPSIDVLFETGAIAYKNNAIAVILTGANSDGSSGITAIKNHGGITIAQNPETASSAMMPSSAIGTGNIDYIKELNEIPALILTLME